MATTMVLARARVNEARVFGRVRFSRGRPRPEVELPDTVATSIRPKRARPGPLSGRRWTPDPPPPLSRDERDLADLLREILPDEG